MFIGKFTEVSNTIDPLKNGGDDIFICCASFEDRTIGVANRLSAEFRIVNSFIFKYDEKNRTNLRDNNFENLKKVLARHSESIFPIICDHHNPIDGIGKLRRLCTNQNIDFTNKDISIDITTFTKQYLLVLLRFIDKQKPKSLRLFYTEPEDYAVRWHRPLSYGLIDIVTVPSFGGHYNLEKESLLILLLGYEGDRAFGLWERFTPHVTIAFIGKPSFRNAWEGRVEKFNQKLLSNIPKKYMGFISTLNPFAVCRELDSLISKYSPKFNISISPLGPKPQVIGCYLSVRKCPDVQIIYAIPKFHEEKYFSKKIGKIWEYR